jgi:hypothetical protein
MMKMLLWLATAIVGPMPRTRARTCDAAFPFRMGAGFPGDVNRTHPFSVEPVLVDPATPPLIYGQAVLASGAGNDVRPFAAGDAAVTKIWGTLVRPFPMQQSSGSNFGQADLGTAVPPATGVADVLRSGYMIVKIPAGQAVLKGGAVFVRVAAPAGAAGNVELCVNV